MLVQLSYCPRGDPTGSQACQRTLKRFNSTPTYLVITLLEVNSLTLHNLHHIVLALWKAARPAQIKEKIEILVL